MHTVKAAPSRYDAGFRVDLCIVVAPAEVEEAGGLGFLWQEVKAWRVLFLLMESSPS